VRTCRSIQVERRRLARVPRRARRERAGEPLERVLRAHEVGRRMPRPARREAAVALAPPAQQHELVAALVRAEALDPERAACLIHQPRPLAWRADELAALVDRDPAADIAAEDAPADAVARLEHERRKTATLQLARRRQPRQPRSDDRHVRLQPAHLGPPCRSMPRVPRRARARLR
jgi:hypothetical protein